MIVKHQVTILMRLFLLILLPGIIFCQQTEPNASQAAVSLNPTERISIALRKESDFRFTNRDSAFYYILQAKDIAFEAGLDSLYLISSSNLAKLHALENEFSTSLDILRGAKKYADSKNIKKFDAQYYLLNGRFFKYEQRYDSAIYYLLKYDDWLINNQQEHRRWNSFLDLANLYYNLKDREKAKFNMAKAVEFARKGIRPMDYLYVLQQAGQQAKQYEDLTLASNLSEEYLKFKLDQGISLTDILKIPEHSNFQTPGTTFLDLEKSLLHLIPRHAEAKNWLSMSSACYNLGNLYLTQKMPLKAIQVFKQGLIAADSFNLPNLQSNMHLGLYKGYLAAKMHEQALHHFEIMTEYNIQIQNMERQKQMQDLQIKYQTAQKEIDLNKATFDLRVVRQRQRNLLLGLLALALLFGLSIYAYRNKVKSGELLSEKNKIITKALKEKDILLKEIHHRVKNNLQMISALLYLQGKSIDDETAKDAIKESENRVQSMAMIHQKLYQDENLLGVDVKDYLDRLFDHLFDSYNIDGQRITLKKSITLSNLDIDTIIPLALIVNELVSNALKYAFKDGRTGEISVVLEEENDMVTLKVEDNGIGLPKGFDKEKTINFGYKLINILSNKLGGQWRIQNDPGTSIHFEFPKAA